MRVTEILHIEWNRFHWKWGGGGGVIISNSIV
jgi:hypothetical protein